jgi:hypothetical protein
MNVSASVFIIENNASALLRTPILDHPAWQERDARRHKIIVEEILGAGPGSPAPRPNKMYKVIRHLRE